jgi:NAD(P)-dependent dehydrogenase (short-subunit alcohol dehydrogenase family)
VSTALVTGAGQGMGAAIAARLARDGYTVAVNDLNAENAHAVADRIGATAYPFDVADPDAAARAVAAIGDVDVLVANHAYMTMAPFEATTPEERARTIDVNLIGTATLYAASKGGLIALVKSAARALGPRGVSVNAIAPGITDTPQLQVDADDAGIPLAEMIERYAEDVPLGRVGRPEDIAEVVAFLCGDAAIALVGEVIQPNGGTTR